MRPALLPAALLVLSGAACGASTGGPSGSLPDYVRVLRVPEGVAVVSAEPERNLFSDAPSPTVEQITFTIAEQLGRPRQLLLREVRLMEQRRGSSSWTALHAEHVEGVSANGRAFEPPERALTLPARATTTLVVRMKGMKLIAPVGPYAFWIDGELDGAGVDFAVPVMVSYFHME